MKILWNKKLIKLSNGSYVAWGLKRKKYLFSNKSELKLNCAIIEYYEEQERYDEKVMSDYRKIIAELKAQIEKMKQDLDDARESANRREQWEIYSVLNDIYNDNFEVITSVSN